MSEIERRLAIIEEKLFKAQVALDLANQREDALIQVLGWLLARCQNQEGISFLIDRAEALEAQKDQTERATVFDDLLDYAGLWLSVQKSG